MLISVKARIDDAVANLAAVHHRHIPFAHVLAATTTAIALKQHEVGIMRSVFDRPTDYVLNALRSTPATKAKPVATVAFREFAGKGTPAAKFLTPQIEGGLRGLKSHERQLGGRYYVPSLDMKRDGYGNVPGSVYRKMLSQLKVSTNADANASDSRRSKAKRKAGTFFKLKNGFVLQRISKNDVKVAFVPIPAPNYKKRFPFYEKAESFIEREYPGNFATALERAIATSNSRGRWQ
jgi:hypothetical protein